MFMFHFMLVGWPESYVSVSLPLVVLYEFDNGIIPEPSSFKRVSVTCFLKTSFCVTNPIDNSALRSATLSTK